MTRVVKIGGRAQADPALPSTIAQDVRSKGTRLCIVHGGGDEVTMLQRQLGHEPRFIGGRRFTSAADVDLVRMVLSGTINKRLVKQLLAVGLPAVGISGEDGGLLPASPFDQGALGAVGIATEANCRVLEALFDASFLPVVSPIGLNAVTGEGLNMNGDDAAAAIAVSLGADELYLMVDVPGVLDSDNRPLAVLDVDLIPALVQEGVARAGMAAKLDAARRALLGGVRLVRIGPMSALQDASLGTSITPSTSVV